MLTQYKSSVKNLEQHYRQPDFGLFPIDLKQMNPTSSKSVYEETTFADGSTVQTVQDDGKYSRYEEQQDAYGCACFDSQNQNPKLKENLRDTILETGKECLNFPAKSTLTAAVYDNEREILYMGQVGDSSGILITVNLNENQQKIYTCNLLTNSDNIAHISEQEKTRITNAKGKIIGDRLAGKSPEDGSIAYSRALGDNSKFPGLIYDPTIFEYNLNKETEAHLLLCSDGIFPDGISLFDIENYLNSGGNINTLAIVLRKWSSLIDWSQTEKPDNMTVMVTTLKSPNLLKNPNLIKLFFVADGAGGQDVSFFIKNNLCKIFSEKSKCELITGETKTQPTIDESILSTILDDCEELAEIQENQTLFNTTVCQLNNNLDIYAKENNALLFIETFATIEFIYKYCCMEIINTFEYYKLFGDIAIVEKIFQQTDDSWIIKYPMIIGSKAISCQKESKNLDEANITPIERLIDKYIQHHLQLELTPHEDLTIGTKILTCVKLDKMRIECEKTQKIYEHLLQINKDNPKNRYFEKIKILADGISLNLINFAPINLAKLKEQHDFFCKKLIINSFNFFATKPETKKIINQYKLLHIWFNMACARYEPIKSYMLQKIALMKIDALLFDLVSQDKNTYEQAKRFKASVTDENAIKKLPETEKFCTKLLQNSFI